MTITEGFAHDDSKGCRMLKLSWTLLGLLMFLLPAGANAVPLTYNLSGVTFSDSGTASGSFQYDAVTNAYSNVNIITTNGGSRSGATYNSVSGGFAPDSGGILLVTMAGAGQTGLPGLALFFSPVLNGAGGMSTLTGEEANCVDPECTMPSGTMRTITAGTVSAGAAATPMTWFLTGFTFADGATATGSFVFDASTHSFSSVNIATTTATRTGATYNTLSTGLIPDATGALFDTSVAPNQTGLPGFFMFFSSPLTGAGGTSTVTGKEADCADPGCSTPTGTMRLITAGTVTTNTPDMTIVKTHVGNFNQGQTGATYTITVTNSGNAPTSGMVSVSDAVPSGLTATGISGTNWNCTLGTVSCTRNSVLAASASYEPITLTVNVAGNAASSVTNTATVSGGGELNTANDTANDQTTINPSPDLTIIKTHVGNFNQGQTGATYTITVTNSGNAPTSGMVSVSDTVPSGLTATAISGTNWNCTQPSGPCTRSSVLAAGGSYEPITLTVNVAGNAAASVTNIATVSGGGEFNTSNDTANDATTINFVNKAPTLNAISDVTVLEDAALQTVNLSGITAGAGDPPQTLTVTASSSNPAVIPNPTVTYTSPNTTGSISFMPLPDANGSVTITVTVKDSGGTANGGVDTFVRTFMVTVIAINDPPVNHVPGPQTGTLNGTLVFSAANSNLIFISDVDAGLDPVQVTLKATDGRLTLSGTTGLSFTAGHGADDVLMTFTGSIPDINAALDGLSNLTLGTGVIQITTNDLGHNGLGGPLSQTDTISVTVIDNLAPVLLTIPGTNRAIAFDSVTFVVDPFSLMGSNNFTADHRTHITLFALHAQLKPGETASAITADADVDGTIVPLIVESVMTVPNFDWLTQLVVKFPDGFSTGGGGPHDAKIRIRLRGADSNQAVVTVVPAP